MKFNLQKIADQIVKIGGPIVMAALAHKLATGKLDLKAVARDAATQALAAAGVQA